MRLRSILVALFAVVFVVVLSGCDDDDDQKPGATETEEEEGGHEEAEGGHGAEDAECEPVGDASAATSTVDVGLDEWAIELPQSSVAVGTVTFHADNHGEEPHELMIVKGVAADALPLDDEGALVEDLLPAGALVGEIETFPAGESCDGTFALDAGQYVLVCNVVDEEHGHVHLAEGMLAELTVA